MKSMVPTRVEGLTPLRARFSMLPFMAVERCENCPKVRELRAPCFKKRCQFLIGIEILMQENSSRFGQRKITLG